ncbi:MAG: sulfatase-like hydrolase/transferase [Thermoplasmata archaeon]|nr:sulfatase-like hydrolase/transferase [Thermoplasmata archaeon]
MSPPSARSPNFLVVIFDALRASDYPGGTSPVSEMPFTTSLLNDSVRFPHASTVVPWTIPAHASAFTGLYPWEHGCHAHSNLVLEPSVPRLPAALGAHGYRSLLLSANTLLCPRFGLVDGFDEAGWGGWWESYIRRARTDSPPCSTRSVASEAKLLERFRDGALGKIVINATEAAYRYPFLFDVADTVHQRLAGGNGERDVSTAPWIEPSLSEWLARQPKDAPVFCAINLCDTHEPYFAAAGAREGLGQWWRTARVRQDFVRCISGSWKPTAEELATLRGLYREMVRNLDRRLRGIVEAFRQAGRWENTSLIATSDHGQAFGEHGELFHLNGVIDPMLRIPLVYRPAGGTGRAVEGKGWASLIDVVPTLLREAGMNGMSVPSAVPLQELIDAPRPAPVFAVSDGLVWNHLKKAVPAERKPEFDRIRVIAYAEEWKLVYDATRNETQAYDLSSDPGELRDRWGDTPEFVARLRASAGEIGERMTQSRPVPLAPDIEERLRGWGYV